MAVDLVKKYDRQGPRYTSYPPVPFWNGAPTKEQWINDLKDSYNVEQGVDLYIHIPFCKTICHYCGCNRIECRDIPEKQYLDALVSEWNSYTDNLSSLSINSVHFGGGTPTTISPDGYRTLLQTFKGFSVGSIELNPAVTTKEHLEVFKQFGINRISLGVQDLNDTVLKAINRNITVEQIISFFDLAKSFAFESINFDLIYGLPFQTKESMQKTFQQLIELGPDVIAFYSYAHVPWKVQNQQNIQDSLLPDAKLKKELFEIGKKALLDNDYLAIGLDHFALSSNFLGKAAKAKNLQRSFMGYTDKKSNILLGLGVSSISNSPNCFVQNPKTLDQYLNNGKFVAGHRMSEKDQEVGKIIHDIMCNGMAKLPEVFDCYQELMDMQQDGLIELTGNQLVVLPVGMPFVRNVAMLFDPYIAAAKNQKAFSRTV